MAKYSSDSDSERSSSKYRRKHSKRSSSEDSSDSESSYSRRGKHSKSRRRRRSRSKSRDRSGKSYSSKHSRGSSRDRKKYRRSRSSSEDRNRPSKRSNSREKSTSRSSSSQSNVKVFAIDKPGCSSARDNFLLSDPKIKASILDDINSDEFVPKQFVSSAKSKEPKMKNIVIDMNADTIHVPQINTTPATSGSIFHTSIMADKEARFDRWVKKLYLLRQKAFYESNHK